jgi:DNA primase
VPALELPVKVGQLIDGIGAADLFVGRLPEPREPLFEQLEHQLDKGPRLAILFGHRITSIVVVVK